ncbi:MAG: histidine kinase [Sphingobacteriaceae bacterium]|nr:histidine kinase [Sphingobacteriaceae bacterium]
MTVCSVFFNIYLNLPIVISIVDSLITNVLLAFACVVLSNLLHYYQPKQERILFMTMLVLLLTTIVVYLAEIMLENIFKGHKSYLLMLELAFPLRFLFLFISLAWCALVSSLWYRIEEQSQNHERLLEAKNFAKEAELNKLRHQLQPHFLFNSLNSVYALTIVNPSEAGVMITKLASFLRGNLKRDDEIWVSVEEEMEYIELYLAIEKVRFSHRLNIDITIAEEALQFNLPGTFVQPIVENAIKFGLYNTNAKITIDIQIWVEGKLLFIQVKNPYDCNMKSTESTGFGLSAIKRRLYLLFGDVNLLQTASIDEKIYVTTLKIPQKNDENINN